eukprot:TRINITY_DN17588_c0_g1_i1.p1 TRINITY_DN17588_c0_g1~~TRINITY_DN17588_c0_g1_i1.p1  ORF type:complete len:469 (+),score=98.33 TRINITY_DN17588_c0_g1_i1:97-1503(+)
MDLITSHSQPGRSVSSMVKDGKEEDHDEEKASMFYVHAVSMIQGELAERRSFLQCFRGYATPEQLFEIWKVQIKNKATKEQASDFMKTWLEEYIQGDLNNKRIRETLGLLESKSFSNPNEIKLLLLKTNQEECSNGAGLQRTKSLGIGLPLDLRRGTDFMDVPSREIAKALTQSEFQIFSRIKTSDILAKIEWNKTGGNAENVTAMIARFNQISFWVTTTVVSCQDRKAQVEYLEKFLKVARECDRLNNFNGLMEIMSGLNHFTVQRMHQLWGDLSAKYKKYFDEYEEMLSTANNFKNYNEQLATRTLPTLPHFGLFMRDFVALKEGNNKYHSNGDINGSLMQMMGDRFEAIRIYQRHPYKLNVSSSAVQLVAAPHFIADEDILYKMSFRCEPTETDDPPSPFISPAMPRRASMESSDSTGSQESTTSVESTSSSRSYRLSQMHNILSTLRSSAKKSPRGDDHRDSWT